MTIPNLTMRRKVERLSRWLKIAFGLFMIVVVILAVVLPAHPWWSASIALAGVGAMMSITVFTTRKAVSKEYLGVGWVVIDYLAKLLVVLALCLLAKYGAMFDLLFIAVCLLAAVLVTVFVQFTSVVLDERSTK